MCVVITVMDMQPIHESRGGLSGFKPRGPKPPQNSTIRILRKAPDWNKEIWCTKRSIRARLDRVSGLPAIGMKTSSVTQTGGSLAGQAWRREPAVSDI